MESDSTPRLLTYADVADRLSVSVRTVERAIAAGHFKVVNVGLGPRPTPRIPASDLEAFIASRSEGVSS